MSKLKLYQGKRVLVTGAGGYIGCKILDRLRAHDCHVLAAAYSDDEAALIEKVFAGPQACSWTIMRGDAADEATWTAWLAEGVDIILHLAAQTSHYLANQKPLADFALNVSPVVHLGKICEQKAWRPRVVFSSSATVVGLPLALPVDERAVCNPITVYDIHKLAGEYYLKFFAASTGLSAVSLRLANVYGPSLMVSKKDRGIINMMAAKALLGEDLTIYGRGEWLRDYIYVDDVVEAFLQAGVAAHDKVSGQVFNICSGVGTRFVDVVRSVAALATEINGQRPQIVHLETKALSPIDERNYVGVKDAFAAASGWQAKTPLTTGLNTMMRALAHG